MDWRERAWSAKNRVNMLPGVYGAYRWLTTQRGEGRAYRIRLGPMRGLRWRRRNALPYWYHVGFWEPQVTALIADHLRPGDVFWDVGANAGYHTIMACRRVGPTGRVVAFEPNPDVVAMLEDNLALNGFRNCTVVQAAISGEDGTATFAMRPNNLTSALAEFTSGEPLEVETISLDSALDRFGRPNLIKLDIEGGEVGALPNGERLFKEDPPRLLLSTHGPAADAFCRQFLSEHGYTFGAAEGMSQMLVAVPSA